MARFNLYDSGGNFLGSAESNDGGGGGSSCIEQILRVILFIAVNYLLIKSGAYRSIWNDLMFVRYATIFNDEYEHGLSWIVRYWTMHGFSGKWEVIQFFIGILSFIVPPIVVYIWKREEDWVGAYCIVATILFSVLTSVLVALFNYGFSNVGIATLYCWIITLGNVFFLFLFPAMSIFLPLLITKAIIPY